MTTSRNRRTKSLNITSDPNQMTIKEVEEIPNLKKIIFEELAEAIIDANINNKEVASLFEINQSGDVIELHKDSFISALEQAIVYFEKREEFEKCAYYKTLISQTNEQRIRKNSQSSGEHIEGGNISSQKTKEKIKQRKTNIH